MCYYNGQLVTRTEFLRLKEIEKALAGYDFLKDPVQSGFDYSNSAVLRKVPGRKDFDLVQMEWGFLPAYIKTREDAQKMRRGYKDSQGRFHPPITTLNAIGEEMLHPGKIYRDAALHRRCLVLSSGFYEWRHVFPANKRTGEPVKNPIKYPYHIGIKHKDYFYLAGIWQPWTDRNTGEHVDTFAIVTTRANPLMEQVHNSKKRMPLVLNEELAYEWLLEDLSEKRINEIVHYSFPWQEMEAYTVAKDFLSAPDPENPFHYGDLPALDLQPVK